MNSAGQSEPASDPRPLPEMLPGPPSIADTIHHRYFIGGIVLSLTAGATWGAWMLWTIAMTGSFHAVPVHSVNAHGEAQIFGWVGLFIMGFAYQVFPRVWRTRLAAPELAAWAFWMMVAGVCARTLGAWATGSGAFAFPLAMAGGLLEIAAVILFVGQILATLRQSAVRFEPYLGFVVAALGWFVASSLMGVWHTGNTMTARNPEELTWFIATYQFPLRDLQIHGLALFMILGVALRTFPALFGLPRIAERRAWWALDLLSTAVVGEVVLFIAYRWTNNHALAGGLLMAWGMLALGAALVVLPWRPWRPFPIDDERGRFARASFAWLAVSLVMLLLMPVYFVVSGLPFSHAYYGATRHAITVGFISLMIMGMASKIVPMLNGVPPDTLPSLRGPFLLINVGCLLRVVLQTMTDWSAAVYPLLGVSGTLEVAGLGWWGFGLILVIRQGKPAVWMPRLPAAVWDRLGPEPISSLTRNPLSQIGAKP